MIEKVLGYQGSSGLFPTTARKKDSVRQIDSIYLHSFILEYLIENHAEDYLENVQRGVNALAEQSVRDRKFGNIWQWLKSPPLKEDYHPADTDDTFRARLIIERAKRKGLKIPKNLEDFDYETFLNALRNPDGSIETYIGRHQPGVCPEVNANILLTLTEIDNPSLNSHKRGITSYLENVIASDYLDPTTFQRQTKYFMSPHFLLYTLSKITQTERGTFSEETQKRILNRARSLNTKNLLDCAFKSVVLKTFNEDYEEIAPVIKDIPLFKARSLREKYSCPPLTAIFCLETLR